MSSAKDRWLIPLLEPVCASALLQRIQNEANRYGSHWQAAVEAGAIADAELVDLVSRKTRTPIAQRLTVSSQAHELVPEEIARRHAILPLSVSDSVIDIATSDPYDLDCDRTVAFATGREVRLLLASPTQIAKRLNEVYRPVERSNGQSLSHRYELSVLSDGFAKTDAVVEERQGDAPVTKLVDRIISEAITSRVSDIHLEPEEKGVVLRYRIDGVLRPIMTIPPAAAAPLVSRIKIMARMDIADRLRPQGGRARVAVDGAFIDLRVSSLPASAGEKIVIRILDGRATLVSLESLGFDSVDHVRLERLLEVREGMILVTGPTGSGKTTTLYAMLRMLQSRGVNIVTVEDPVEYRIAGIAQVQVNERTGLTFAAALRTVLRQDPDIILVGEIRDRETATIALQAALTGHLVLSTLHTIDACSAVPRLTDLGVDPAKLAGALKGVIAQRLLRRICAVCSGAADARTCGTCARTGYRGRLAAAEVVHVSPTLERAIASLQPVDRLTPIARADGARSLWESGRAHVTAGRTTRSELERVIEGPTSAPSVDYHTSDPGEDRQLVTQLTVDVVDVYALKRAGDSWRVLGLRRSTRARCPGAWEVVHGTIDPDERPEDAAVRESFARRRISPSRDCTT
jgi:type II secretory ATPase GspE/PulE/Tfp pilus assembly ATPase PilB-like protein